MRPVIRRISVGNIFRKNTLTLGQPGQPVTDQAEERRILNKHDSNRYDSGGVGQLQHHNQSVRLKFR